MELQVRDQSVVVMSKSQEKASVKCQEEDIVRSKYRALKLCVDQVTIECIGNNELTNSRRQILKGEQVSTATKQS